MLRGTWPSSTTASFLSSSHAIVRTELDCDLQLIKLSISSEEYERILGELWESGTVGIIESESELTAFFEDGADLALLAGRYHVTATSAEKESRTAEAVENGEPVKLGKKFLVCGASQEFPSEHGRHVLHLLTSEAFGSGRHESTQLVVEALEELNLTDASVLDVGCGSGIVSQAARLLGAALVIACDIELESLQVAHKQFPDIAYFLGSADAIRPASTDVVVANISAKVLDILGAELVRILRPGGTLLLSGFIEEKPPSAFSPDRVTRKNDWLCWSCTRNSYRPAECNARTATHAGVQPFDRQWW